MTSRLQQARSEETRLRLLDAARTLFTERGYAATSTEELVREVGVTRGALYHHFDGKQAIFEAVFLALEEEFAETARRIAVPSQSAWENLQAGCRAFLDMCLRPDVQRIVLLDGPAVLGPGRWREVEDVYALAPLVLGLTGAMRDGVIATRPAAPLARMLLAAINEGGLFIAQADDAEAARNEVGAAFDVILNGLRVRTARD